MSESTKTARQFTKWFGRVAKKWLGPFRRSYYKVKECTWRSTGEKEIASQIGMNWEDKFPSITLGFNGSLIYGKIGRNEGTIPL